MVVGQPDNFKAADEMYAEMNETLAYDDIETKLTRMESGSS